ncbi:2OG-Fe(II) oxygenase [Mycobacterium simiae]|uniref:2OG-Fe(II) oxygenase n=1 Tax=Mycobacterium simiae TaxID=1784 RepID=A0A5B1BTZ6_MYCSI|nr:2OG-Fe(II) oxygenase [Mycobacterium simiae]
MGQARPGRPAARLLDDWLAACRAAAQIRLTAVMLKYGIDDWTALHQDLYGDLVFPLQLVINLRRPDADYTGGKFDAA